MHFLSLSVKKIHIRIIFIKVYGVFQMMQKIKELVCIFIVNIKHQILWDFLYI